MIKQNIRNDRDANMAKAPACGALRQIVPTMPERRESFSRIAE
jgi:hypothetical protein